MKMKTLTLVAFVAALCACNQKLAPEPIILTAYMEGAPETKTTLEDMTPKWEVGDIIRVNTEFYEAQNAGFTATFWPLEQKTIKPPYEAILPTSYLVGRTIGGTTTWSKSFPQGELYYWVDGQFNMPMYAKSNEPELHFKNLCGVLRITIPNKQFDYVQSIRIYNPDKKMMGEFSVDENGAMVLTETFTDPLPEDVKMHVVAYIDPVPVLADSKVFYVPVPPQSYNYIRIDIAEEGLNFVHQLRTKGAVTIERNKIYDVTYYDSNSTEFLTINPAGLVNSDFE